MHRKLLAASLLALSLPSGLFATQASLYGGGGIPHGQLDLSAAGGGKDDIAEVGGSLGGQFLFDFNKIWAAGIDLNYTKFGEKTSTSLAPVLDSTLNLKTTVVMAVAKWTGLPDQKVRPYLLGGIGFHNSSFKYEGSPSAGLVWLNTGTAEKRSLVDDSKTGFAAAFGVGLDVYITPSVFIGGEARFQYLGRVKWDTTTQGKAFGLNSIEGDNSATDLLLKLGVKFQTPLDSDTSSSSSPDKAAPPASSSNSPGAI